MAVTEAELELVVVVLVLAVVLVLLEVDGEAVGFVRSGEAVVAVVRRGEAVTGVGTALMGLADVKPADWEDRIWACNK